LLSDCIEYSEPWEDKKATYPMMDEIFKLMNESMPNQELVYSRSNTSNILDSDEIHIENFNWYEVGEIICMLQKLQSDPDSPILGKPFSTL